MTKINNKLAYPLDVTISDEDYVIGTDGDNLGKITKNFDVGSLRRFINSGLSPEVGGTLRFTEITYNGLLVSPADVANALDPIFEVLQYHVVVFNINGNRFLLKSQAQFIGVDQTELLDSDFILIIGFESLGDGTDVLKGYNTTTKQHEFYSVKSTGNTISIVSNNIVIDPKQGTNLGEGQPIYKGLNASTKLHEFYNLKSNTLNIELTDNDVLIDTPETASIPALYVNNLYVPTEEEFLAGNTKGEGTLAKPFTDTVTAYLAGVPTITANTAIQNVLDAYVGSGTRLAPEKVGQKIIIQDNNNQYNFAGDFGYSRLNIEANANIVHTGSGKIFDMDNATHFNALQDSITITIGEGYFITSEGDGAYNSGSNVATNNFAQSRIAFLKGKGVLYFPNNNIIKYGINSDILGSGNNNDGNVTFQIECIVRSDYQGVYKIGGNSRIYVYGKLISGLSNIAVDTTLKSFVHLGGQVRFFEGSSIEFGGNRIDGFIFTPTSGFTPNFIGNSPTIQATSLITNLFTKTNSSHSDFALINSNSGVLLSVTNIFESPDLWEVGFKGNTFESGLIDPTKADLTNNNTISSTNIIGEDIIETLVKYSSKSAAYTAGLPLNSVFLISNTVTAGSFVVGREYKIVSVGTTDFTLIGASANTVGLWFVATGVGTGTGTAKYEERTILT